MTQTKIIIRAIKEMNTDLLDLVLDNKNSYLDVAKDIFLKELSNKFTLLKNEGVIEFKRVSKGTCQKCNLNCSGFTFLTEKNHYLDLIIEEKENKITDITQCLAFKNEEEITKEKNIFLYFKKDIRSSYVPTSQHVFQQQGIEKVELEFKEFENQIIDLEIIENWLGKWSKLFNSVKYMDFDYSFICSFQSTYFVAQYILSLKKEKLLAEKALFEFNSVKISNDIEVINWLIKYKENQIYYALSSFTKTKNWNETNFVIFENQEDFFNYGLKYYENIIIDIRGYKNSIEFGEIYSKYYHEFYDEIEQKQEPAK